MSIICCFERIKNKLKKLKKVTRKSDPKMKQTPSKNVSTMEFMNKNKKDLKIIGMNGDT